ncbi:hypothetical protein PHYBLDRAFT_125851 [Phycomyces blakesleeanus NRRL 1555(-)]|uniref:mitochondrial intermediate peptidase n=2 Tax=Phycomyces blakesleeanus TaxID=4837 RepID=A0A163A7L3_PHYB8|nr:hypothetical protein PHYBLDRAFT_125851 [Phycomyces blakesleeanus NRRL 1555(-)]OAD71591.1 hypothetical protein PHYBLDRAFT_125851 [Phycomyces blakesleeanus NRRL 1555(-)]|eukprot:XP_018289631.1 hypothetical protein PHYBLDRAFT_125851 [Phycomyces blakesleeanus NRRL 1555(-)]
MQRVVKNLDRLSDTLCNVIDMAEFIRNAHPNPVLMEAANKAYSDLCSYMNTLNTDTRIHQVLSQVLADKNIVKNFSRDEHAAAEVFLRDFEKSGIHLPKKQRTQFVDLSDKIIHLGREFIQRNPRAISHIKIPKSALTGMSHSTIQPLLRKDGYAYIQTDSAECQMVLKYCTSSEVRQQVYESINSANRESITILEQLMRTRAELAGLVGRSSFAELQLQDKMAKNPQNVEAFLQTLIQHQTPDAQKDIKTLQKIKQRYQRLDYPPQLNAWDRDYYMHMANATQRNIAQHTSFTPYFSVGSVMQGISRLFNHMYGVQFEPARLQPGESWHDDVRKLNVVCEREGSIGTIYCDLFSRPGKTTNAAHYTVRTSRRVDDDDQENDVRHAFPHQDISLTKIMPPVYQPSSTIPGRDGQFQMPVVALTCDFTNSRTQLGSPALLSMYEVETLFHEMGHAMHSMLGRTDFHNVAGTRCATDFVELPSILMEHFVWHPSVLPLFTKGIENPVSREAVNAHLKQRRNFSGIEVNSQILMAMLDQRYHSEASMDSRFSSVNIWHELQNTNGLFPSVPGTMWPVQFGHLFGYGAGYYSYLFDRTLARRIWERCFEKNPLDREKGLAFRDNLLKWGGARDPWECVADVLDGEDGARIAAGDKEAMQTVGDWGINV